MLTTLRYWAPGHVLQTVSESSFSIKSPSKKRQYDALVKGEPINLFNGGKKALATPMKASNNLISFNHKIYVFDQFSDDAGSPLRNILNFALHWKMPIKEGSR